jgi:hypothetical protein
MSALVRKSGITTLQSFRPQLLRTSHSQGRSSCRHLHHTLSARRDSRSAPPFFRFPPFKPFITGHTSWSLVPSQSFQRLYTCFLPSSLVYYSIYSTAYHVRYSNRWPELSHVISRWYDYVPCDWRVYGSWNDGGVDVLCLVGYLPS